MNITPGYNFSATEVPSRATLGLMASGMSISNIGLAQVSSALITMSITDGSVVTLPSEGWLWVDARSNIWGRNRYGSVIVRKSEGGWESNRIPYLNAAVHPPGGAPLFSDFVAGGTNISNARLLTSTGGDTTGAIWRVGVNQETVASTATSAPFYGRTVYRGMTRLYGPDFAPLGAGTPRVFCSRNGGSSANWLFEDMDGGQPGAGRYAQGNSLDPDGNASDYIQAYFFPMVPL